MPIGELARRRDVPVQFLEQLFAALRRAGIISSQRGVKGGYRFAREPATVTVLEIVELLDGPLGRDAEGVFADAAAGGPQGARRDDDRGRDRARAARGRARACTTSSPVGSAERAARSEYCFRVDRPMITSMWREAGRSAAEAGADRNPEH